MNNADLPKIVGQRVLARRLALGMTQEQLAAELGYKHKSSISKIESGEKSIQQKNMPKVARVLKTSVAYLMGYTVGSRWESSFRESYWEQINTADPADCRELFDVEEWNQIVENDAITLDFACNVADTFGISLDSMTGLESNTELSPEERKLIAMFRKADDYDKKIIWTTLERYQEDTSITQVS